jgi:hypothetical protein
MYHAFEQAKTGMGEELDTPMNWQFSTGALPSSSMVSQSYLHISSHGPPLISFALISGGSRVSVRLR